MKKLVYLFVAPLMCFSTLVSCGGGGDKPGPTPDKGTGEELCFTSLTDNSELDITFIRECNNEVFSEKQQVNLQYKINDGDFKDLNLSDLPYNERKTVQIVDGLKKNDKVYLRGDNKDGFCFYKTNEVDTEDVYYSFCSNEDSMFDLSGNIMSLISAKEFSSLNKIPNNSCFQCLFSSSGESEETYYSNIKNAKDLVLPASELAKASYYGLFGLCNTLITPPEVLPAINVPNEAYEFMFEGCELLKKTPKISAQNIEREGMYAMFSSCSSLTDVCNFNFKELDEDAAYYMFKNCLSLKDIPLIPTDDVSLGKACYGCMFNGCKELDITKDNDNDKKLILDTTGISSDDLESFGYIFDGTKNFIEEEFTIENAQYYI